MLVFSSFTRSPRYNVGRVLTEILPLLLRHVISEEILSLASIRYSCSKLNFLVFLFVYCAEVVWQCERTFRLRNNLLEVFC